MRPVHSYLCLFQTMGSPSLGTLYSILVWCLFITLLCLHICTNFWLSSSNFVPIFILAHLWGWTCTVILFPRICSIPLKLTFCKYCFALLLVELCSSSGHTASFVMTFFTWVFLKAEKAAFSKLNLCSFWINLLLFLKFLNFLYIPLSSKLSEMKS